MENGLEGLDSGAALLVVSQRDDTLEDETSCELQERLGGEKRGAEKDYGLSMREFGTGELMDGD